MKIKEKTSLIKRLAFTLAEVLITIGIIGVVAEMTIPTLLSGFQKTASVVAYKKFYTVMNQAFAMAELEYGASEGWAWGTTSNLSLTTLYSETYLYPYLNIIKKCEQGVAGCWKEPVSLDGTGGFLRLSVTNAKSFITADGFSVLFWAGGVTPKHGHIYVDINGPAKGPGVIGKDVFNIMVFLETGGGARKGVYPIAGSGEIPPRTRDQIKDEASNGCSKTTSGLYAGRNCGALMMIDGWQIMSDYPW